ncbi:uncharacterized protein CMC5_075490 [Chondromyces crocatus]|uniref:Uncharacterized protein n=2 Tax=Chondromyces crocatus TaxID=52 RepID=A0A0K1ERN3_CHOCO|nr:uncharacterized protein CMC5_075490 [Chondromyces crocatus]
MSAVRGLADGQALPGRPPAAFTPCSDPLSRFYSKMTAHPEWPTFSRLMRESGVPPLKINQAWGLLMSGIEYLDELKKANDSWGFNPYYEALGRLVSEELEITPGTTMALWAGGLGVSDYAEAKGHTTLESSRLGKVIMALKLHSSWPLLGPMWNVLSRAFVARASSDVHIYMRSYDPNSVLIRAEVPGLREVQALNENVRLHWHALYTDKDGKTSEITPKGDLSKDAEFANRDLCVAAMFNYLIYRNEDPDNISAQLMKELLGDKLPESTTGEAKTSTSSPKKYSLKK